MTRAFVEDLAEARLMAIIRGREGAAAAATALALFEEGVRFVEIALTTPGACEAISEVRARMPGGVQIGAGTVLTAEDVDAVEVAGAQFVVTPAVTPSIAAASGRGIPVVAGAMTPTEAWTAIQHGASVIKLFPASSGGPGFLKAVRDPFPDIPFLAVGGVGLQEVAAFLDAGALGVGVGGPLVGDAASGGGLDALREKSLRERARAYLSAVADAPR